MTLFKGRTKCYTNHYFSPAFYCENPLFEVQPKNLERREHLPSRRRVLETEALWISTRRAVMTPVLSYHYHLSSFKCGWYKLGVELLVSLLYGYSKHSEQSKQMFCKVSILEGNVFRIILCHVLVWIKMNCYLPLTFLPDSKWAVIHTQDTDFKV